jgi:hypothetical protein
MENRLTIKLDGGNQYIRRLPGRWVYIETDGERNGAYRLGEIVERRGRTVTLDLGETTLVRGFADDADFSRGYVYNIAPGARLRIPLAASAPEGI